jgi:hypothetical protein
MLGGSHPKDLSQIRGRDTGLSLDCLPAITDQKVKMSVVHGRVADEIDQNISNWMDRVQAIAHHIPDRIADPDQLRTCRRRIIEHVEQKVGLKVQPGRHREKISLEVGG